MSLDSKGDDKWRRTDEFAIVRHGDRLFIRYIVKIEQAKTDTWGLRASWRAEADRTTERPLHFVFSLRMRQLSPLTHRSSIRFCTQSSQRDRERERERRIKRTARRLGRIPGNVSIGINRRSIDPIRSDPIRHVFFLPGTCSTSPDLLQRDSLESSFAPSRSCSSRSDMIHQFSSRTNIRRRNTSSRRVD